MALHWSIHTDDRIVGITARGDLTRAEIDSCLVALVHADAVAYRKLVDIRHFETTLTADELLSIGFLLREYARFSAPVAVLLTSRTFHLTARILGMLSVEMGSALHIFDDASRGLHWLESQPDRRVGRTGGQHLTVMKRCDPTSIQGGHAFVYESGADLAGVVVQRQAT